MGKAKLPPPVTTVMSGKWVMFDPKGIPVLSSAAANKATCIQQFINDGSEPWSEWNEAGWNCEEVTIHINLLAQPLIPSAPDVTCKTNYQT